MVPPPFCLVFIRNILTKSAYMYTIIQEYDCLLQKEETISDGGQKSFFKQAHQSSGAVRTYVPACRCGDPERLPEPVPV